MKWEREPGERWAEGPVGGGVVRAGVGTPECGLERLQVEVPISKLFAPEVFSNTNVPISSGFLVAVQHEGV